MTTGLHALLSQAPAVERVEQHLELARWSSGNPLLIGGLLTAFAIYAVIWFYYREGRGQATQALRWSMIVCRTLVLLAVGFICLDPVRVNYLHRRIDAVTLVLADNSASMSLVDPYRDEDAFRRVSKLVGRPDRGDGAAVREELCRARLVERLLASDPALMDRLSARNAVKVFSFSQGASLLASIPMKEPPATQPASGGAWTLTADGPATDLGRAIRQSLDSLGDASPAAIVLLSDGGFNAGEPIDALASLLKQKGIPLYAVGIGDPSEPVNVAVTEIAAPRVVFKNDPFDVTVRLSSRGTVDREIEIELSERLDADEPKIVDTRRVRPASDGNLPPIVFQRKSPRAGTATYLAEAKAVEGESVLLDNHRQTLPAVRVLDDRIRVLIVAGAPSYDYRYLSRLLERDKAVDVSCWLQSADAKSVRDGNTIITELPATQDELLRYDAILMLDPDPAPLESSWSGLVENFVAEHGGGLLYQAGNKYTGRFLRAPGVASIVEMLPVAPDPDAEIIINELGQYQPRGFPLVLTDQGLADAALRLADSPTRNRDTWAALEGAYWHYPVRREKPAAQVLLRHSDPRMAGGYGSHVLLATQYVGAGRSAYLGFNTTWRWRRGDEKLFNRFWTQIIRSLVEGKLLGGNPRCQIQIAGEEYEVGQSVVMTVRLLDEHYQPLIVPQVEASVAAMREAAIEGVTRQETLSVALSPVAGREGYYQGRFTATAPGTWRVVVSPSGAPAAEKEIAVVRPDLEMRETAMKRDALRRLADSTGGKYLDIDEAAELVELIPARSRIRVLRDRPRALWDNGWTLAAMVLLLSVEWVLRKKAKLL